MLALKVDVSYGTVWTIVHDRLRFRKECAAWAPKQLIDQQKKLRMGLALQHLFRYQKEPAFMKRIDSGDETWCHHYEPETKRDGIQWKHASSSPTKKFRAVKQNIPQRHRHIRISSNGYKKINIFNIIPSSSIRECLTFPSGMRESKILVFISETRPA
ncbi:histone-lysine N-methyltransferase SETMAR [Trichonephila inaurata madagascariensis]|uniref:Histone-lysine N-methyltransferase SETMAR n=1 Tax=Trichonephila inaurata madagascariensis TaxID=2747483 RepID=A0A8X6Y3E8_9ARAC|nr:histone-lysine N-methyltransferase SETMAR [Trichonephila inaurata madagascariensis]